jgi:hypothetical protein
MSDDTPRERAVDRRTLIVGGVSAVAVAAVAPAAAGAADSGPEMIGATVAGDTAGGALEVVPIASHRHVSVGAAPGADKFEAGDTVAVFLAPGSETDVNKVGSDGPVEARAVSKLVFGKRSGARR